VSSNPTIAQDCAERILALYDAALPYVFRYLLARCGRAVPAEEITSETMLAAIDALKRDVGLASGAAVLGLRLAIPD
jgi:RNA polymerase sigma-70 factor (ECF subfamily)